MKWLVLLLISTAFAQDWSPLATQDGITVSRRQVPGSGIYALKGIGTIDAPAAKLITVMRDVSRQQEWMDRLKEARVVRANTPYDRVLYTRFSLPWPLVDRDFVFRVKTTYDRATRTILNEARSVEDPGAPVNKCCVRGQLHLNRTAMTLLDGGAKTQFDVEVHADPNGAIPKWAVNLVQKTFPRKSIAGMLRQVVKPDVAVSAEISELLK